MFIHNCKIALVAFVTIALLTGCGGKDVPEETPAPTPEHMETTTVVFSCYDDSIVLNLEGNEAVQTMTDTRVVLLPDKTKFDVVSVDYIQGNSLINYGAGYYEGLEDDTKSAYENDSFITSTNVYAFTRTEKNSFLMVKGPVAFKDYCLSLRERLK